MGDAVPMLEDLQSMGYLRAVLKEGLRLYRFVPEEWCQVVAETVLPLGSG